MDLIAEYPGSNAGIAIHYFLNLFKWSIEDTYSRKIASVVYGTNDWQ